MPFREGAFRPKRIASDRPEKSSFRKILERTTAALALSGTVMGGAGLGSEKPQPAQEIEKSVSLKSNSNDMVNKSSGGESGMIELFKNIPVDSQEREVEDGEEEPSEDGKLEFPEDADPESKDAAEMLEWFERNARAKTFKELMEKKFPNVLFDYDTKIGRLDLSFVENGVTINKICRVNFYEEDGVKKIAIDSVRGKDQPRYFAENAAIEEIYTELVSRKNIFVETQGMNRTQINEYLKTKGVPVYDRGILLVRTDR